MNLKSANAFRNSARWKDYFLSYKYPLTVAAITLAGYILGIEFYLNFINMLLLAVGIIMTRSALPIVPVLTMYLFSISPKNSPESHFGSDFYNDAWVICTVAVLFLACVTLSIFVIWKNGALSSFSLSELPIFGGALLLSSAFLLGGAFSGEWEIENLLYASMLIAVYFVVFYFFHFGFKAENKDTVLKYLVYTGAAMALVLTVETLHLYITSEDIIKNGEIVKEEVLFGWGMWTMAGQFLAVTIPLCFLGVMRERRWWIYFTLASLALISVIFTLSRNALLIGGAVYLASAILCCFFGKHKWAFRIAALCAFLTLCLIFIIFRREILTALSDYIERGFSNNGRFALWKHGIVEFFDSPLFGKGFFGLQRELADGTPEGFSFYPRMMHNTVIQLLGSCGIFGFFAYTVYRISTLLPFFKKPNIEKTMLLFTLAVVILGSLIDNFLFLPKHMLLYPIVLAAAFKIAKE